LAASSNKQFDLQSFRNSENIRFLESENRTTLKGVLNKLIGPRKKFLGVRSDKCL